MSDGFLAGIGLDEADEEMPDARYPGYLVKVKLQPGKKEPNKKWLILTYKVADPESPFNGETLDELLSANAFDDKPTKRRLANRLASLGVPKGRMDDVKPEDLQGTPVWFNKKRNGQYVNVTYVEVREEGVGTSATVGDAMSGVAASAPSSVSVADATKMGLL